MGSFWLPCVSGGLPKRTVFLFGRPPQRTVFLWCVEEEAATELLLDSTRPFVSEKRAVSSVVVYLVCFHISRGIEILVFIVSEVFSLQ